MSICTSNFGIETLDRAMSCWMHTILSLCNACTSKSTLVHPRLHTCGIKHAHICGAESLDYGLLALRERGAGLLPHFIAGVRLGLHPLLATMFEVWPISLLPPTRHTDGAPLLCSEPIVRLFRPWHTQPLPSATDLPSCFIHLCGCLEIKTPGTRVQVGTRLGSRLIQALTSDYRESPVISTVMARIIVVTTRSGWLI